MLTGKFLHKHTEDTVIPQLVCFLVHVCVCLVLRSHSFLSLNIRCKTIL